MLWKLKPKIQIAVNVLVDKKSIFLYGISFLYLLLILIRYRAYELSDFLIFWNSSKFLTHGFGIYYPFYPGMPYLNGPLLTLLLAPTTKLPYQIAFDIWFIFNVVLIWYVMKSILHLLKFKASPSQHALIFSFLVFSYPIRHNLAIGSVVLLILALNLVAVKYMHHRISEWQSWFAAFAMVFTFELKPYLVLIFALYLVTKRNFRFLLQSFSLVLVLNFIYFLTLNDSSWLDWIKAMSKRTAGLTGDRTMSSLHVLLRNILGMPDWISFAIYLVSILLILVLSWKAIRMAPENYQIVLAVVLGPIISLYSHPQDFVMIIPFAIIFLLIEDAGKPNSIMNLVIFSLFLNLSGSSRALTLAVMLSLIVILKIAELGFSNIQLTIVVITTIATQNTARYLLDNYTQGAQLEFLNSICLISGYLCWWLILSNTKRISHIIT